jgi:OmpA-OmpF porin, OOP family
VTWDRRPPRACIAADKLWAPPIEFKPNKYTIVRESFVVLDGVVELLLRYPELPAIEIQGHLAEPTEPRGGSLSEERAEAVEDYLVAHGIEPARIRTKGFGQDVPIADTRLEASRRLNRRIELVFVHPLLQRTCE